MLQILYRAIVTKMFKSLKIINMYLHFKFKLKITQFHSYKGSEERMVNPLADWVERK